MPAKPDQTTTSTSSSSDTSTEEEKTEVLYGAENIVKRTLSDLPKIKERFDNCTDFTGPSVFLETPIWKEYVKLKDRGVKLRFITEITKENIHYCKELMKIAELRHLDGVKGNFGIADGKDYSGGANGQEGHVPTQLIRSTTKTFVEQQQFFFETLWNRAISAEQKLREIEEGIIPIRTRHLENQDEIIREIKRKNNSAKKLSICTSLGGMQMSYNYVFDSYKNVVEKYRKGESKDGMRWLMDIEDKKSIPLVKTFLEVGIRIRHIKHLLPLSFGVTEKEVALTIEKMEEGKKSQSFLLSSEPLYVSHFNSLFDELWKKGIEATERIKIIEEGIEADIEVIQNPTRVLELYLDLVVSAEEKIMLIFPTTNAFIRQEKTGIIQLLEEVVEEENKIKVRILMPTHELTEQIIENLRRYSQKNLDIRFIEKSEGTKAIFLVVDKKFSLMMEIRDDSKETFDESIGLSIYSTSRAGVLSYVSIFESLWNQTELYEQIKAHDKLQKEFINVAAHELRTPIQPILGLSEVLLSKIEDNSQRVMVDIILRNAKRLQRLTEDILDVTKIESQSLKLNREKFNLNDIVLNCINDMTTNRYFINNEKKVKLLYEPKDVLVEADKGRVAQLISNLLSNAIKFTNHGEISINVKRDDIAEQIIVSVMDTGQGMDPEILPKLFTKFATKSFEGTGLGLFISKSIIEAHGGKIWAENNPEGKGATFSFSLPV